MPMYLERCNCIQVHFSCTCNVPSTFGKKTALILPQPFRVFFIPGDQYGGPDNHAYMYSFNEINLIKSHPDLVAQHPCNYNLNYLKKHITFNNIAMNISIDP